MIGLRPAATFDTRALEVEGHDNNLLRLATDFRRRLRDDSGWWQLCRHRAILPDEVQDVALMSDGLEPLAMQFATRKAHEPFFRTVLAPLHAVEGQGDVPALSAGLTTLLASPAVRSRTNDDASLVIATRRSAQP